MRETYVEDSKETETEARELDKRASFSPFSLFLSFFPNFVPLSESVVQALEGPVCTQLKSVRNFESIQTRQNAGDLAT